MGMNPNTFSMDDDDDGRPARRPNKKRVQATRKQRRADGSPGDGETMPADDADSPKGDTSSVTTESGGF